MRTIWNDSYGTLQLGILKLGPRRNMSQSDSQIFFIFIDELGISFPKPS